MKVNDKKKVFIAARFGKIEEVKRLKKIFEERGYIKVGDWTNHKSIKPYDQNQEIAR